MMLSQQPLLQRSGMWILVAVVFVAVAAAADVFGDALSAVMSAMIFGF